MAGEMSVTSRLYRPFSGLESVGTRSGSTGTLSDIIQEVYKGVKTVSADSLDVLPTRDEFVKAMRERLIDGRSLSGKKLERVEVGIKASMVSVRDYVATDSAGISYEYKKNSPFNGLKFKKDTGTEEIEGAITSSSLMDDLGLPEGIKMGAHTALARVVKDKDGKDGEDGASVCYAGRPDTSAKAMEMIAFMHEKEKLSGSRSKGIVSDADGKETFTFVVRSLMDLKAFIPKEPKLIKKEMAVL
jgi:hypothetical protein